MENKEIKSPKIPKVFISYSWTNDEHIEKVISLAERLISDGVDVLLDIWDAPEGVDLNYYMEKVNSNEIDFVLIISDEEYAKKANQRKGGVGTETQIISKEVYKDVEQTRVIPIVWDKDKEGNVYLPEYLATRKYIDLSRGQYNGYEKLLRRIHNIPEHPKPQIGEFPYRLLNSKLNNGIFDEIIFSFEERIDRNPLLINIIVENFLKEFLNALENHKLELINNQLEDICNEIYEKIDSYTPIRDSFIKFFEKVVRYSKNIDFDFDIIINFFEDLFNFTTPKIGETFNSNNVVHYDFIIREIFLYLITISLHYRNYNFIANILNSPYYFKYFNYSTESQTFLELDQRGKIKTDEILTYYYNLKVKDKKYITGLGNLLIDRLYPDFSVDEFVDADLICCYISIINLNSRKGWFPFTYIYKGSDDFELFRKLTSKKHFEKVKNLLDVQSIDELKEKIILSNNFFSGYRYGFSEAFMDSVEPIGYYIKLDDICTLK